MNHEEKIVSREQMDDGMCHTFDGERGRKLWNDSRISACGLPGSLLYMGLVRVYQQDPLLIL
jgi:hypothetical protein